MFVTALHRRLHHRIIRDGLIGWWPFDEGSGSIAYDAVGSADGTFESMDSSNWVAGWNGAGHALEFDGSVEYLSDCGSVSDFSFVQNTHIFSVALWLKIDVPSANAAQVCLGNSIVNANKGFAIYFENRSSQGSPKSIRCPVYNGSTQTVNGKSSNDAVTDTGWHHVVVTMDGSDMDFYVDGVFDGGSGSGTASSTGDSSLTLNIGRSNYSSSTSLFDGKLDDVRIYNRVLTADEVAAIYAGLG